MIFTEFSFVATLMSRCMFQIRLDGAEEGDPAAERDGQERETGRGGGREGDAGPDRGR